MTGCLTLDCMVFAGLDLEARQREEGGQASGVFLHPRESSLSSIHRMMVAEPC